MELKLVCNMTASALYDYNMHYTYTGAQGLIGTTVVALLLIGYGMNTDYIALLAAGLVIILYLPITLFVNSRKQMAANPAFKQPMYYTLNDEGVTVSVMDEEVTLQWEQVYKAYSTNQSIVIATGKANAWIFPKKDLGEDKAALIEMISTHVPPQKIRIKQ